MVLGIARRLIEIGLANTIVEGEIECLISNIINEKTEAVLPGTTPYTVAIFEKVISDPRDSFVKALFVSPVNIQELKFVEVKK